MMMHAFYLEVWIVIYDIFDLVLACKQAFSLCSGVPSPPKILLAGECGPSMNDTWIMIFLSTHVEWENMKSPDLTKA